MTTHGAMVLVEGDSLTAMCPYHGAQAGAEYRAGVAPCGCEWRLDRHGVLRARRADVKTLEHAIPLRLESNNDSEV